MESCNHELTTFYTSEGEYVRCIKCNEVFIANPYLRNKFKKLHEVKKDVNCKTKS
jgi:hypothetical protein